MNNFKTWQRLAGKLVLLGLAAGLMHPAPAWGLTEQTFDLLQIGTRTYTNVTVTTKSRKYVFIMHASGMTNLKVAELPSDVREKLGYTTNDLAASQPHSPADWAKQKLSNLSGPKLQQLEQAWTARTVLSLSAIFSNPRTAYTVLGLVLATYLFFCYCSMLICRKTNTEPGGLVWVPVLQLIPMLRAAGMSPAWFLAFLVPVLNVVAQVTWYVKIVQARGKSLWVAFWLLLPFTNLFAYLYLAFSSAAPVKEERHIEIMTLETF